MKPAADKKKKQRAAASMTLKPPCGTLSYLAECRSAPQKAEGVRRPAPPADIMNRNRIVRNYPADR
jgi:hypothetical protein